MAVNGRAITIQTDNVTLDLRGHSIVGNGSSVDIGVYIYDFTNIEVRNGSIRNVSAGISMSTQFSNGRNIRVIGIRVVGAGISLGGGSNPGGGANLVRDCVVSGVTSGYALTVYGTGSIVQGNEVYGNANGILALLGSLVLDNVAHDNTGTGITTTDGCTAKGNVAYNNGAHGIRIGIGSSALNNTSYFNKLSGIVLDGNNLADGNTAYNNDQLHFGNPNMTACATCTFGVNHAP